MAALDAADYSPIDHLNALFGHESTLPSVPAVGQSLQLYQDDLDSQITDLVIQQSVSDSDSFQRMQAAKTDLAELFHKMNDVQTRAAETERTIADMTAEIKRLDNTKRNLTLSMTALKRLQMLTTAYEQLQGLRQTRQYKECAQLVQAVIQLMAQFKSYRSIDQIAALSRNVSDLQRELLEQVCEDFEVSFAKAEIDQKRGMLAEGCLVMEALGDSAKSRLITWYCNTQLREYRQVFRGSDEAGSLDNISRRYSWFRRMLKTYDDQHAALFPISWRVDEILANAFCQGTREDFKGILSKTRKTEIQTLDANLLLSCLQETLEFEQSLEKKFSGSSRVSMDTMSSVDDRPITFSHAISEAFEPYLGIWVEAQDKILLNLLPKYRSQPPISADEIFNPQMVIHTSTELFNFYRNTLAQCLKISNGSQLVELSMVFGKYLDQYAQQILLQYISERPSGATPSRMPSVEDIILVLNTSDYCYITSNQLEERMKARANEDHKDEIDLQTQADAFMGIASASVRSLVRKVEVALEPSWRAMRNTGWSKMESVGDQSTYVNDVCFTLREQVKEILNVLHKQQYARAFCDNVVELLAHAFTANIMQIKPISEIGAEQLLLDLYALQKQAEELTTVNAPAAVAPPAFIKRTAQMMSRVTPLLKTLQVLPSPPESLVEAYLIHVADKSDTNFQKILDLKGIRKQDQSQLKELFTAHKAGPRHEKLPAQSAFLTPLVVNSGVAAAGMTSLTNAAGLSSQNLASLPGRFDPSSLGSAFLTAAKDGVERFGTPTLGNSNAGSRSVSPPPNGNAGETASGNVNQNLKNLGKFFKRDLGGFSGRFGKAADDAGRRPTAQM